MDSSRFIGPTTGSLHARSVPPVENVDRRVSVGVVSVPARGADEGRLVLAASAIHGPAGRAGLRRVARVNLDETGDLVGKHRFDLMPADVQDCAVQAALLCNVPAGGVNRSFSGAGHVLGAQPFDHNTAVTGGNVAGNDVRPMLSGSGLPGLDGGNAALCLRPTNGTALAAGCDTLRLPGGSLMPGNLCRELVGGAIREHKRDGDATVNPNGDAVVCGLGVNQAADADLPSENGSGNGCLADASFDRARQSEANPSDFWQPDPAPTAVDLLNPDLSAGKREGVMHTLFLRLRVSAKPFPRAAVCFVKRLQRALLGRDVHSPNKVELGSQCCQFASLRDVVEIVAGVFLIAPPMVAALFNGKVPDQPAHTSEPRHHRRLIGRWAQLVCEATEFHIKLYGKNKMQRQDRESGFLPGMNAGVSTAGIR